MLLRPFLNQSWPLLRTAAAFLPCSLETYCPPPPPSRNFSGLNNSGDRNRFWLPLKQLAAVSVTLLTSVVGMYSTVDKLIQRSTFFSIYRMNEEGRSDWPWSPTNIGSRALAPPFWRPQLVFLTLPLTMGWIFNGRFSLRPQKLCPFLSYRSTSNRRKWFCVYLRGEWNTSHPTLICTDTVTVTLSAVVSLTWVMCPLVCWRVWGLARVFCLLYCLFMARVDTAYAGELSLCRKTPGTVLREWRTPHECVFTTHTASRLHLNSCSVLSLSLQPWAPCAASHSPIELASLGAAIHWISWPLFPWIQCLTVPP